ncbi:MAG: carbohydrate-binding protein, partial [Fibrobacteraceae bacterium]|nr:carbohydrate-binding protein [Fibrobacteraceae bacterium]
FTLPGVIQMEDYDVGGQGISYSDNDPENQGNVYREDGVDVVGFGCSDTLNTENCTGYAIGYTNAGEWVEYSFNAEVGAKYSFMARVASGLEGAGFMLYVDGSAVTDTVSIPAGDGWDTYVNVNGETAMIEKGQHILRVKFTGAYGNMDWIEFALERGSFGTAITNAPKLVPNNVKAKVFDINGRFVGLVQIRNASSAVEQLKTMGLNPGIYMVKVPGKNGFMVNTTH